MPCRVASCPVVGTLPGDRKSTRLNSSHLVISYAVFCLKKKIDVPDLPDRCATREQNAAHLAGRQAQHREARVLGHELDSRAGRARHLRALAWLELTRMR